MFLVLNKHLGPILEQIAYLDHDISISFGSDQIKCMSPKWISFLLFFVWLDVSAQTIVNFTAQQDKENMMQQLGIKSLRAGASGDDKSPNRANNDEALANPFLDYQIIAVSVFKLLVVKYPGLANMPAVNVGLLDGYLAWRQHDGGHTDAPNIKYFIQWANKFISK